MIEVRIHISLGVLKSLIVHGVSIVVAVTLILTPLYMAYPQQVHAATTVIFLTTGTTWTVPSDWNSSNNTIEVIGGGGAGGSNGNPADAGGGGGGGAYSKKNNLSLTPGAVVTIAIGLGGTASAVNGNPGGDTYFNGASCAAASACAKGGGGGIGGTGVNGAGGAGGVGTSGVGDVRNSGGTGATGAASTPGGGGGAAGGVGAGSNGSGTTGGSGDAGLGGAGGVLDGSGGNGTEWDATHGSGGGSGGNKSGAVATPGNFGGGGGGGNGSNGSSIGGSQGIIVITYTPGATTGLSCSVTTAAACTSPSVIVLRMSSATNGHAELPSQSTASYSANVLCCTNVTGLGNTCGGTNATVLKLQAVTNSHVQQSSQTGYTNNACISISSGSVTVGYQATNCTGYDTTVGSMSAATNAQVGGPSVYATKICASAAANSLTFLTDASSEAFPSFSPGTLVATSSILTTTTGNSTGFLVTIQRATPLGTMALIGSPSVIIPDKSPDWIAPAATTTVGTATASTTQPLTLQFRIKSAGTDAANYSSFWWGSDDTTANARFAGISSTSQTILNRSTAAAATTTAIVLYNLNAPVSQQLGSYSGSITYSATANP